MHGHLIISEKISSSVTLLLAIKLSINYKKIQLESDIQTKTEPSTSTTKL